MWFELASHLKVPVGELMSRISSTEFLEWCLFLEKKRKSELAQPTKIEHYLAALRMDVHNAFSKKQTSKIERFLLSFTTDKAKPKDNAMVSKNYWLRAVGLKK